MAEYIDKNKLKRKRAYLFETRGMPFPKCEYFIKRDDIFDMPTVDVVEREKIDKAIKEIEQYGAEEQECGDQKIANAILDVLEILKRNTGE